MLTGLLEQADDEYGGAAEWLLWHGLTDAELTALRGRLVRVVPVSGTAGGC